MKKEFDIITLGSATEDVFIKTDVKIIKDKNIEEIVYPVGSKILIKHKEHHIGGGGTNTAVAFSRLGLKTAYLGMIGNDTSGINILNILKKENVSFIGSIGKNSGYSVILDAQGKDRTILTSKGCSNDLEKKHVNIHKLNSEWIYSSSMMGKSFTTLKSIFKYAKQNNTNLAFNPSLYQAKMGLKRLGSLIQLLNILILNKEEAFALSKKDNLDDALLTLKAYVEDYVVITDGPKGTVAYDGINKYFLRAKRKKVVEATGAGDAFASGFVYSIYKHKNVEFALSLGQIMSESVLQAIGAKEHLPSLDRALKMVRKEKYKITKETL